MVTSRLAPSPGATPGSLVRRFCSDKGGSIAIMFALMFVTLALFVGSAVDIARWLQARHQTIAAMDAAVLAGARVLQIDNNDVEGAVNVAQSYYTENTRGRIDLIEDTPSFSPINNNRAFAGTNSAYIRTTFLNLAHVSTLPLEVYAEAALPNKPLEISMMLDVTGSMSGSKIRDLKLAAEDLVDIVLPNIAAESRVRLALVPFAEGVRLPQSALTKARGTPHPQVEYTYRSTKYRYYPTECVVERKGAEKYTDAAPVNSATYVMTLFNNDGRNGTSGKCGLPAADEVVPLTNNKNLLKSRIQGLVLSNTTAGHIGTAWAWYMLSPNWNALWDVSNGASPYDGKIQKIAVLMTDGEYNLQYDTNGVSTGAAGAGSAVNGTSTNQARALCTEMKKKDVLVYTVGFALGKNSTAVATLDHCATDASMAYNAADGSELRQAFRDIALKINRLYLTH